MIAELFEIYTINNRLAIKLSDLKKIIKYRSESFLIRYLKKLLKNKLLIAYKWKKNWYIFLPKTPITRTKTNQNKVNSTNLNQKSLDTITTPSGNTSTFDWNDVIETSPPDLQNFFLSSRSNTVFRKGSLSLSAVASNTGFDSSSVAPKNQPSLAPFAQNYFPATLEYRYGYYLRYNEALMSIFDPGTGGTLKSINIPSAFFELCRAMDAAENARNGANPGLPPQRNISTTVSFDTGTIAVAATIPILATVGTDGVIQLGAVNYLGTFGEFLPGGGDLTADTLPEALVEIATLLSNAEKAITPAENQPDNVQVNFDLETGSAIISANLPFTSRSENDGAVTVIAIDYL